MLVLMKSLVEHLTDPAVLIFALLVATCAVTVGWIFFITIGNPFANPVNLWVFIFFAFMWAFPTLALALLTYADTRPRAI